MRLLFLLLFALSLPVHAYARPNIILVLVDDLGWDDPAFMGNAWHETPAMDRLASRGTVFTQAYAAAPNCKPSRASLLTGRYPTFHGIYTALPPNAETPDQQRLIAPSTRFQLAPGTPTLASVLHAHGYRTALIGKWDLGDGDSAPTALGFDRALGWFRGGFLRDGLFAPFHLPGLENAADGEYLTTRLNQEAVHFIESSKQPFFLMLSHYAVHLPLQAPADTVAYFRNKPRPGEGYNATYAAMLKVVDDGLADIVTALDNNGLRDNTIIIVTSDNGAMTELSAPSRLAGGKGSVSEGGIRVPLIWAGPGSQAVHNDTPVSQIDILPTLMRQVGVDDARSDGADISGCLQATHCDLDRALYWHFPAYITDSRFSRGYSASPIAAVRTGPWKLVHDMETGHDHLFNLANDPAEQHDLAASQAALVKTLSTQLQSWQTRHNAAQPVANAAYHQLTGWSRIAAFARRYWEGAKARLRIWLILRETR